MNNQRDSESSIKTNVDSNDSEEYGSSSSDEEYLEPGEPYGTFLKPTQKPYDRRERVEELNKKLETTDPGHRTLPVRVRIKEEYNQYFVESSGNETDTSTQLSNGASVTSEGHRRSPPEAQRRPPNDTTPTTSQRDKASENVQQRGREGAYSSPSENQRPPRNSSSGGDYRNETDTSTQLSNGRDALVTSEGHRRSPPEAQRRPPNDTTPTTSHRDKASENVQQRGREGAYSSPSENQRPPRNSSSGGDYSR